MAKYIVEVNNGENENVIADRVALFETLKEYAIFAYEQECKREDTIRTQASSMQSAFSFVSAAIVMLLPVTIQYRGNFPVEYIVISFSTILVALGLSLLFATLSQKLISSDGCLEISEQKEYFKSHYNSMIAKESQIDYLISYYDKLHKSKRKTIKKRIFHLNASRYTFIIALSLCAFWLVVSLIIYFIL